jgi:hypothetical protein
MEMEGNQYARQKGRVIAHRNPSLSKTDRSNDRITINLRYQQVHTHNTTTGMASITHQPSEFNELISFCYDIICLGQGSWVGRPREYMFH